MRGVDLERHMGIVVARLRRRAWKWVFNGRMDAAAMARLARCTVDDETTETRVMFSRDSGHHSSGWMKNPDYERCLHLSLSPRPSPIISAAGNHLDRRTSLLWARAFFGDDLRKVWVESPKSAEGRARDVWHWRVFCDRSWTPLLPRGEVYSTELTELGWKSASELGRIIVSTVDPT